MTANGQRFTVSGRGAAAIELSRRKHIIQTNQLGRAELELYAQEVGLDMATFKKDLDTEKYKQRVHQDFLLGRTIGVGGTPTIYINGRKYGGTKGIDDASKIIELVDREILKKN